jgi:hypothetical protein
MTDSLIHPLPGTQATKTDSFLENLLGEYPRYFKDVLSNRDSLKVQIIYTQIDRDAANKPLFRDYFFNVNPAHYFYPASTVKLPVALLALQKLHELSLPGLDRNSTFITESAYGGQTAVYNDPTAVDGRPSVAQYIKKIFLVSDNDAFNRLYEFLGQEYINGQLHKMGYMDVQIRRRLAVWLNPDENQHTNPISFFNPLNNNLLYQQPMQVSRFVFGDRNDFIGKGYYSNTDNSLINKPMDFSTNNRISLEDQHRILRSIIFPDAVPVNQRFHLAAEDYRFLYQYMSQYPSETRNPSYDSSSVWDAYCKFLYWGSEKGRLPKNIRIFNKVGDAYGFLTDIIYFTDQDRKIEFMLSATIYCNSDGILNDDKYDYETIGYPFMKNLGRIIYAYELNRERRFPPDLSKFQIKYDK